MTDIVAVTEKLSTAGALVYWRLSGIANADRLKEEWLAAGLDESLLPDLPKPTTALRHALRDFEGKHRFVRRLPEGGWALVGESAVKGVNDLEIETEIRVNVDAIGQVTVEPAGHPLAEKIRAAYVVAYDMLTSVSGWLAKMIRRVDAVALRDTGGIYFVPAGRVAEWTKMADAVAAASQHQFFQIPAMRAEETVSAILDAVQREAEQEAQKFEADLQDEKLGAKALRTRAERCANLVGKVRSYAELLGQNMETLTARLGDLEFGLGHAALKADAEGDDAAQA